MLKIEVFAKTHPGLIRETNEDNFCIQRYFKDETVCGDEYAEKRSARTIAAVFDGIGGGSYGEKAAYLAAQTTASFGGCLPDGGFHTILNAVNENINSFADEARCSTGCTAAMLHYCDGMADICNLGDSRIYLFRDGMLERLSKDHTELQRALDMNLPNFNIEKSGIKKGKLTKYLGVKMPDLSPHIRSGIPVAKEDMILICSDGLTDMVSEERICKIMSFNRKEELTDALIQQAIDSGGKDNITVMIAAFSEKTSWISSIVSMFRKKLPLE